MLFKSPATFHSNICGAQKDRTKYMLFYLCEELKKKNSNRYKLNCIGIKYSR